MAKHTYTVDRREYYRQYMATRRAEGKDTARTQHRNATLPFVGVDGEGGNVESGYHAYFLLTAGGQSIVPTDGNVRLTTTQCLDFLDSLPRDAIYVVYFGDYDVTKILEDLGWDKLTKLMDRSLRQRKDGKGVWPVDYGPYQVDYLPRKEFKVRKERGRYLDEATGKTRIEYSPWLIVNDVGSFFQTRFVEALEKWDVGTAEQREAIGIGKEARGTFDFSGIEDIATYNALEIELLQQLMSKFRAACSQVGYMPAKWQGPGQLAEAMLSKHGVPLTRNVTLFNDPSYLPLIDAARAAFYGGRPEVMAIGPVDRQVAQFDINSAYPYAMLSVPCLEHGTWERVSTVDIDDDLALCYGSFHRQPSNTDHNGQSRYPMWYGLPVRTKDGTITYPGNGRGWYWSFEIRSAQHQRFDVEQAWLYKRCCDCRPLAFVSTVYRQRQSLGKDGPGIVLKLALNSLYGKQVQSVGSPKYSNPIWGSYITAYCRSMIQGFIHTSEFCTDPHRWCGKDVLMIATDSVCTFNPRPDIVESSELGGWSVELHPRGMFIVQPGLYFGSSSKPAKTRGVPRSVIESYERTFRDSFAKMADTHKLTDGDVDVPQRLFCGIRYALHRRNLRLLGQWIEFVDPETGRTGKTIRFDWSSKRHPYMALPPNGFHSYIETYPQEGDSTVDSVPYSKDIGGLLLRNSLRGLYDGQPDWIPQIELGELGDATTAEDA